LVLNVYEAFTRDLQYPFLACYLSR
jgi:hypothetical protein